MKVCPALILIALAVAYVGCGGSDDQPTTTANTAQRVLVADSYKPSGEFCPTSRICVRDIKWSAYDAKRAVGVGAGEACEMDGGCNRYPALRITFTRPQQACGALRFTRLETFGAEFRLAEESACRTYGV